MATANFNLGVLTPKRKTAELMKKKEELLKARRKAQKIRMENEERIRKKGHQLILDAARRRRELQEEISQRAAEFNAQEAEKTTENFRMLERQKRLEELMKQRDHLKMAMDQRRAKLNNGPNLPIARQPPHLMVQHELAEMKLQINAIFEILAAEKKAADTICEFLAAGKKGAKEKISEKKPPSPKAQAIKGPKAQQIKGPKAQPIKGKDIRLIKKYNKAKAEIGKKTKDPNAPKRPKGAYLFWLNENRDQIKQPGMAAKEVTKAAGIEWNALKDKSKWEIMAAEDKVRYAKEMADFRKAQ